MSKVFLFQYRIVTPHVSPFRQYLHHLAMSQWLVAPPMCDDDIYSVILELPKTSRIADCHHPARTNACIQKDSIQEVKFRIEGVMIW